jgi:hypothetical protein
MLGHIAHFDLIIRSLIDLVYDTISNLVVTHYLMIWYDAREIIHITWSLCDKKTH